ncbi:MAG: hypothetical protein SynsKO_04070 [Synoicihabitans sp.]
MNLQQAIHWLEQGRGAAILKWAAAIAAMLALGGTVAFKQFHGPRSEETLRQADLGRAVASGQGFTSSINYPQAHAILEKQGRLFDPDERVPEMYHAPGYALVIAATLAVLPERWIGGAFENVPEPPNGFGADYILLGLNLILMAVAVTQSWLLGTRLFDRRVGWLTGMAVFLSTAIWGHVVAVDGTLWSMVLLLGLFQALVAAERRLESDQSAMVCWGLAGLAAGLLFLTDYPYGVLVLIVGGHAFWHGRKAGAVLALGVALVVATPWLIRNVSETGNPVGLAAYDLAMRSGDTTADPVDVRNRLSAEAPNLSLNKMGNKVLTAVQITLREKLWAGGGLLMSAFFVTGWIYHFKRGATNRLRILAALALVLMVLAQGLMNSGEGERVPTAVGAPLIILFGAGFFMVLVTSSPTLSRWPSLAMGAALLLQGLPLIHDVMEPRRIHFSYPPYYPGFFKALGDQMDDDGPRFAGWMADVPAGAAWYSGQRVWSQPRTLRDFYAVHVEQRIVALVLTPETLDRPFFAELVSRPEGQSSFGEWGKIYTGLITGRMPAGFPLTDSRSLADNFHLIIDGGWVRARGK